MRISTKGRYSLEALLFLALLPDGSPVSAHEIAKGTGLSERYLEQLFIPLKKKRIIAGTRGAHGGYSLGKNAASITVGDILRSSDVDLNLVSCAASGSKESCPRETTCGSRQTWRALHDEINAFVDSVTLADLTQSYNAADAAEYVI